MKRKLEELGSIPDAEFEKRISGLRFSSVSSIICGCACVLYILGWLILNSDAFNLIDDRLPSFMLMLMLGFVLYIQGRSGMDRVIEYRFIRQILKDPPTPPT